MPNACTDCIHYEWNQDSDTDGVCVTAEWVECKARPALANLKSFPFKKTDCASFEARPQR